MNCSEFEKRIYLYRELTAKEKEITDKHIAQCESCSALAAQVFQHQELLREINAVKPTIKEPDRLTQRIMNAVKVKDRSTNHIDAVVSFLNSLFVRYAFSTLSVLLIAFFFAEQQAGDQTKAVIKTEITQGVTLNSSSFLRSHFETRQKKEQALSISRYTYNQSERFLKTL